MKLSDQNTPSLYRRYRIVDETDLREALAKTEAAVAADRARMVSLPSARESGRCTVSRAVTDGKGAATGRKRYVPKWRNWQTR